MQHHRTCIHILRQIYVADISYLQLNKTKPQRKKVNKKE